MDSFCQTFVIKHLQFQKIAETLSANKKGTDEMPIARDVIDELRRELASCQQLIVQLKSALCEAATTGVPDNWMQLVASNGPVSSMVGSSSSG
jgi:hypothetical protein